MFLMDGIALIESEIPAEIHSRYNLGFRRHQRGDGEQEYRFLTVHRSRELPVWLHGQFRILPWGNQAVRSMLPRSCWTWATTIVDGSWRQIETEEVVIPCNLMVLNGYWTNVRKGIRGLVAFDSERQPHVYVVCKEPSKYFANATRSNKQPMLVDQEDI